MPDKDNFSASTLPGCPVGIPSGCMQKINAYINLLLEYNRQVNLTAITGEGEIWRKHVMDSLLIFCALEIPAGTRIIDVGTGAGIPGLILKIYRPDLRITLLEAQQKKVKFLQRVVDDLKLAETECLWGRAEELGHDAKYRESFAMAVARGVAPLNTLAEYCLPLVAPGGTMVAYKGPAGVQELAGASGAITMLGGGATRTWQHSLPGGDEQRTLVIIRKERTTPARFPRRPGMPAKRPLK